MKSNRIESKGLNVNVGSSDQKKNKLSPYHYIYVSKQWRYARRMVMDSEPLCECCQSKGIVNEAESVNHIIPLRQVIPAGKPISEFNKKEKDLVFGYSNLESLCSVCHGKKEMEMIKNEKAEAKMELDRIEEEKKLEAKKKLKEKNDRALRRDNFKYTVGVNENGTPIKISIL